MRTCPLRPNEACRAFDAWADVARACGLDPQPFRELSQLAALSDLPSPRINTRGHLSAWLGRLDSKRYFGSFNPRKFREWIEELRDIEARHVVLVSEEQLIAEQLTRLHASVFDLLLTRLALARGQLRQEVKYFLSECVLTAGYALSSRASNTIYFIHEGLAPYPALREELEKFQSEAGEVIYDYEEWLAENNIKEYTHAIKNGLLASLPVLLVASLADGLLLPWIQEHAIEALTPIRKSLEIVIRYITGGAATVFIWLNLERTERGTSGSHARTVYRAATIGTLIGPCAVTLAHLLHIDDTTPGYAFVAMLAASADNLLGAFTQLSLRFASNGKGRFRASGLSTAFRHPFFLASIGAIVALGLLDALLRIATGGVPFAWLSAMGLEGLIMGVGDTLLIYFALRGLESLKISQLSKKGS